MDELGRYYTDAKFSELLVQKIENSSPNSVLDLGVGGGSLIRAAFKRWKSAQLIAADIDNSSLRKIHADIPLLKVIPANGLKINVEKAMSLSKASIDVAVCNPPYAYIKDKKKFKKLLEEADLHGCYALNRLTSDIVFLAQNLRLLKDGGELGIILPDSVITGKDFTAFRQSLLNNHKLKGIIELPNHIFSKTEAKTHILMIEKGSVSDQTIPLFIAQRDGICVDQINMSSSLLENRMDFSFHRNNIKIQKISSLKRLSNFNYTVKRGNVTHAKLKLGRKIYLHSTSYKNGEFISLKKSVSLREKKVIAEKGDLIITRVGKRCVGKVAILQAGQALVSDCIFVIRADKKIIKAAFTFLQSKEGAEWIETNSHGVCSRVLNMSDIANLPLKMV